jgi:hypothetical protein
MEILVEVKMVYGLPKTYPLNDAAKVLARLIGKKTFDEQDLRLAMQLGHTIRQGYPQGIPGLDAMVPA